MTYRDVVVIGAGPAGLIAAREAARRGATVTVLEEHAEIGVPCHCAGLLSIKGLKDLGIPLSSDFVQNRLKGARFYSPSGLSFVVGRREAVACAVDRSMFDKFLAEKATRAGAEIRTESRVKGISRVDKRIAVEGSFSSLSAGVVVDAEGVASRFVKAIGLRPLESRGVLPALQFELEDVKVDPAYAEIYVGNKVAPGFFAWVIPLGHDSVKVGLGCKRANVREKLESFIQTRFGKVKRAAVHSGRLITCGPISRTFDDNFIVVGDAAGQVKPTTGGGVILGGVCAAFAGEVAVEAMENRNASAVFLEKYERLWKSRLGGEFRTMRLARQVVNRLSDKTTDKLFKFVLEKNLQEEFSVKGDIDFQGGLLSALVKKRDLIRILLTAAPDLLRFKMKLRGS
jgi:digeranylgeranylglycerophospholipid reductase